MKTHRIGLILLTAIAILVFAGQANASYTRTLFSDDFNDGNYTGWTKVWGTCSVVSGALRNTNGQIVPTSATYAQWRTQVYTAKMRTVTSGANPWDVGWMLFRYTDSNNAYYLALMTNGLLELSKKQGGTWYGALVSLNVGLAPSSWHTFSVKAEGARITVSLNGVQRFTYDDPNPIVRGKIGFEATNSTAELDDVVVTQEQQVLAHYLGWYGDASQSWKHWQYSNPVGTTTWHVPKLGLYSSTSQTLINTHADWAVAAGIDGFLSSWYHNPLERDHFLECNDKLIAACNTRGKKFCLMIESNYGGTPLEQINYLKTRYCGNSAYLYKAGKPVFYIWQDAALSYDNAYWASVRQQTGTYLVIYTWTTSYTSAACDAEALWLTYTDTVVGDATLTNFYNTLSGNGGAYSLPVNPGFDNHLPTNPTWWDIILRDDSMRYEQQWTGLLSNLQTHGNFPGYHPDLFAIVTWNDWHESSSIEPCDGTRPIITDHDGDWGFEYLQKTATALGVNWVTPADGSNFYDTFATNTGRWTYVGNAYRDTTNRYVVLTQNVNNQAGAIWFATDKTNSNMTIQFRYKAGGGTGADGMCVMFYKNKNYTPAVGGGLGFQGTGSFQGYGVEIDNYNNGAWNNDPSANHFALIKDSVGNHILYYNDARTEDNQWHTMKVVITSTTITIYVDNMTTPIITYSGAIDRTYGGIGFGAGTQGANNWHIVDDVYIAWS